MTDQQLQIKADLVKLFWKVCIGALACVWFGGAVCLRVLSQSETDRTSINGCLWAIALSSLVILITMGVSAEELLKSEESKQGSQ